MARQADLLPKAASKAALKGKDKGWGKGKVSQGATRESSKEGEGILDTYPSGAESTARTTSVWPYMRRHPASEAAAESAPESAPEAGYGRSMA